MQNERLIKGLSQACDKQELKKGFALESYRGCSLEFMGWGQYFWSHPDFQGDPTESGFGSGTLSECHDEIDEYLESI